MPGPLHGAWKLAADPIQQVETLNGAQAYEYKQQMAGRESPARRIRRGAGSTNTPPRLGMHHYAEPDDNDNGRPGMAIKTLLITGANNHDWKRSAPYCDDLMRRSARFDVDLTEDPCSVLGDRATLSAYQLLFVDYNGPDWDAASRENFIDAVRQGTGVCILHAANNAFDGWKEFEEICALCWREGTGHGAYHRFDVTITDPGHPITKGLPPVITDHPDELYHNLVHMHDAPYEVIATAFSSEDSGGTGGDQPVLVVKTYGEGRVFHCILGHVWEGGVMDTFESPDFQQILLRGCEWAATGEVNASPVAGE